MMTYLCSQLDTSQVLGAFLFRLVNGQMRVEVSVQGCFLYGLKMTDIP